MFRYFIIMFGKKKSYKVIKEQNIHIAILFGYYIILIFKVEVMILVAMETNRIIKETSYNQACNVYAIILHNQ